MSSTTSSPNHVAIDGDLNHGGVRRQTTETKSSFKTTEFFVYIAAVVGVFIASAMTDLNQDGEGFGANQAAFLITLLTIGYMISRGLAKSGSRERNHA